MDILIVDDEKPARDRLYRLLQDIDGINTISEAENGVQTIQFYENRPVNIILLDIRMPLMDGMETAKHLMSYEKPPAIIFTTAYGEQALQAFETHAVDYLVKPIRAERLKDALKSAQRLNRAQLEHVSSDFKYSNTRSHLCVRKNGNLKLIPVDDIFYLIADQKYVSIVHHGGKDLIDESLVNLEHEFQSRFLRVHRNALVATQEIASLEKMPDGSHKVALKSHDRLIEISRRHLPTVRKFIRTKH